MKKILLTLLIISISNNLQAFDENMFKTKQDFYDLQDHDPYAVCINGTDEVGNCLNSMYNFSENYEQVAEERMIGNEMIPDFPMLYEDDSSGNDS